MASNLKESVTNHIILSLKHLCFKEILLNKRTQIKLYNVNRFQRSQAIFPGDFRQCPGTD